MQHEPELKRWTAKRKAELVKEIIKGKTAVKEAARNFDLTPADVERRVDDAMKGMGNALKANPMDVREQYENKIDDLHAAYGEAMLEVKFLKKLQLHLDQDDG
ncbi:transposase [Ferrimonas kyonanensis]|uniref:transposase n=1 Tax=Ferrimonas kyonanensis TaxID=364763 RepID=UPI000426C810|nr:transposase [Ferrimonas kyonanensis]